MWLCLHCLFVWVVFLSGVLLSYTIYLRNMFYMRWQKHTNKKQNAINTTTKPKYNGCVSAVCTFASYLHILIAIYIKYRFFLLQIIKVVFSSIFVFTGFNIFFRIFVFVIWIHKGYILDIKLVWNIRIKAFWYITRFCCH